MSHLLSEPKDISILKAYWVNHAVDQSSGHYEENSKQSNKRQVCVGIYGVDIHPDGSRFATCGADEKIKIWSMAPIISVDVEVSKCIDKLLCVCQYEKRMKSKTSSFNNTIHCVKWSHNGRYLASGSADGIVTIWGLQQNQTHHIDNNNNNNNNNSPFNQNENINYIENWVQIQQLTKHRDESNSSNTTLTTDVQDIVWSPNDDLLISAGSDHNIQIWQKIKDNENANNFLIRSSKNNVFKLLKIIFNAHNDIILGLSFDGIGEYLLSQSADGTAKIWSIKQGFGLKHCIDSEFKKRSHFIRKNTNDDLTRLDVCHRSSWSPDGMYILTSFGVSIDNIFISPIYNRDTFKNNISFVGHSKPTTVSKWNPRIFQSMDNNKKESEIFFVAAVGSMDRKLSIWKSNRNKPLIVFTDIGKESVLDITWSRTGDILMASTHDGNVMVFIFGKNAFHGNKLSINQHCKYIENLYQGMLNNDIMNNIRNNISLCAQFKFNQTKPRQKEINNKKDEEEKQDELINKNKKELIVIDDDEDDDLMNDLMNDGISNYSQYIPTENVFAPKEDDEINLILNYQHIKFNVVEGKQKRNIPDYYRKQQKKQQTLIDITNSNHSTPTTPIRNGLNGLNGFNDNTYNVGPPPLDSITMKLRGNNEEIHELTVKRSKSSKKRKDRKKNKKKKEFKLKKQQNKDHESGQDGDIEMDDGASIMSINGSKRRKRDRDNNNDNNNNNNNRKRRKYNNDKLIKIEHEKDILIEIEYIDINKKNKKGILRVESKLIQRNDEFVSEIKQFKMINNNNNNNNNMRMEWKTEIPCHVIQIVCNQKWTVCGTIDGELYFFNHNGRLIMPPIQMEEEIVLLYMSSLYTSMDEIDDEFTMENDVYLMIITSDCTLREWKLNNIDKNDEFDPIEMVSTNFSNLLKMNSNYKHSKNKCWITLKNVFITNSGEILLTLSNGYIFTYKQSLNCWLRVCDDKYWLSNQRKLQENVNDNNINGQIGKLSMNFSQLICSMNNSYKEVIKCTQSLI